MKTRKLTAAVMSVLLSFSLGCSVFRSSHQALTVMVPDQEHAGVWINDAYAGEAPVTQNVKRNRTVFVTVKKAGYQPLQQAVKYHLNSTGILDAIGTYLILLPVVGVASPGSHSLDETALVLHLTPEKPMDATNAPPATQPGVLAP